jgi:5,10-methenyltetrahydrofolate synthetase
MDPQIRAWRVKERLRLKQERQDLSSVDRRLLTDAIARNLDIVFDHRPCRVLGLYWPIKGEFDLRAWAAALSARTRCALALPVVVREQAPLEYWQWRPGDKMKRGFWGIMVPERREQVTPDAVIAPLVGFSAFYRLGHGGGYFDRTLAGMRPKPLAIGIGTETSHIKGFVAQAHDIPMDMIITEAAVHRASTAAEAAP